MVPTVYIFILYFTYFTVVFPVMRSVKYSVIFHSVVI